MRDSASIAVLAELAKRRPAFVQDARDAINEVAARLRSFYHPKQAAYYRSSHPRRATKKTRRAGATSGGCRELIARAIEHAGFRATYVTTTRREARERAWMNDTQSGLLDVLRQFGTPHDHPSLEVQVVGGVRAEVRGQDMVINFENGSQIDLFGADDERALRKQRGLAKHVYWIDEAQDFRHLERFYDAVVIGSLTDYKGECWLSGTPGIDCSGMFYDITKDPGPDGPPLAGWEVHTIASVDNPLFGHTILDDDGRMWVEDNVGVREGPFETKEAAEAAAIRVRWDRSAGAALRAKNWKGDEPDFVREWLGKWVREDARFVYPVHSVPQHELLYAPERPAKNPLAAKYGVCTDHPPWVNVSKAITDLPKMPKFNKRRQWLYAIGVDFGYHPDPFAMVVWAFASDTDHVYELFSWKAQRVHTDHQGEYMEALWKSLDNVVAFVADPAGKQDDFEMWRTRMNLPIEEANKRGKNTLEEFLADDIRRGRVHLRIDSPLYNEMRHLVYLPGKLGKTREVAKHRRSGDGKVHGDHCADAARYAYAWLTHYMSRTPATVPAPDSPEGLELEAARHEARIDAREQAHADRLLDGDEQALDQQEDMYGFYFDY